MCWLGSLCLLAMSGVGCCVHLPEILLPLVSHCLPTCVPVLMVRPPSRGLVSPCLPCLPLSPHMCPCVGWWVRLQRVLFPVVSNCLGWCVRLPEVLSPLVSHCLSLSACSCLPLSPYMCACVGWCVRLPEVLPSLSPIVSPHVCLCWMLRPPSRRLVFP